jgi:hypothetical protein
MIRTKFYPPTKFTFKKFIPTGRYRSFEKDSTDIKLKGRICGHISETEHTTYRICFVVPKTKEEIGEGTNCVWKWLFLKKQYPSENDAREWIIKNADLIRGTFNICTIED